jgi:hypothetical protein
MATICWMRVRGSIFVILGLAAITCSSALARPRAHGLTCARRPGHTLRRAGAVRIYRQDGHEYGCVRGSWRTVPISGLVEQLAGVAALFVQVTEDDQYAYAASTDVVDLQTGKQYRVSSEDEPLGLPWSLAPGLVETVVLGADGDTARLYETPAPTGASDLPPPTTETLDVVGHSDRVFATGAPGSIDPRSIRFAGGVITWTQNGISYRARLASAGGERNHPSDVGRFRRWRRDH